MHFQGRFSRRDAGADFQHVRAQDFHGIWVQMVRVIFHERHTPAQPRGHHFHRPHQRGGFPIALRAEAIAVGHEPLHGDAGQLGQPVQILECVGETP